MSWEKYEKEILSRLHKLYESGTSRTTHGDLFKGMNLNAGQKATICDTLESISVIKGETELGHKLPFQIDILPAVNDAYKHTHTNDYLESSQSGFLENPVVGTIVFMFKVVVSLLVAVWLVIKIYQSIPN